MKRRTRLLPIRLWIGILLGLIIAVPALTAGGVFAAATWQRHTEESALAAAQRFLGSGEGRWGDPTWQVRARTMLAALGVDAVLIGADGRQLFASASALPRPTARWRTWEGEKVCIGGAGSARGACGTAALFVSVVPETTIVAGSLAAGLLALLPTLLGVAWFLRRAVVRPLTAMSSAATAIGDGHLDVQLPASRIREVADVAAALDRMGAGLRAALERQATLEQERRLFVGAIAHDLRTPLFTLRAYLGGLGDGLATTPEKAARYVAVCQDKAGALERMIADLFAYAQVEYLEQEPRREPLDLGCLLQGVVESFASRASSGGVALVVAAPSAPCPCEGDSHLLTRVAENLLDNALRYTPSGGQVTVRWGREGDGGLCFAVEDTGPGIAAQDLPHLFTPLYRGESSRNRRTGGAGLGLAIARRILQAHGGGLVAANRAEGGAAFTGTLPGAADAGPRDHR